MAFLAVQRTGRRGIVELMRGLIDLVLPAWCVGCGEPGATGCASCLRPLDAPARWTRPEPAPAGLPPVATIAAYDGPVRDLLIGYKEHGARVLARPLGAALGRSLALAASLAARPLAVVPVPSSSRQCRRRGGDLVAELALAAARELGAPADVVRALRHVRPVADSAGLDAQARAGNTAGALGLRRGAGSMLAGRPVVIVDDLVTTGASLTEAARALRDAGATVAAAATVAATSREHLLRPARGTGIRSPAAQPHRRALRC